MVFAAACLTLFVFLALEPLRFGWLFRSDASKKLRTGFAFGAFRLEPKWSRPKPAKAPSAPLLKAAFRAGKFAVKRARLEKLRAEAVVSLGDAALTALGFGALSALCEASRACLPCEVFQAKLSPGFRNERGRCVVSGIVSLKAGDIMLAAALFAAEYAHGRISQWTSTRLKAS